MPPWSRPATPNPKHHLFPSSYLTPSPSLYVVERFNSAFAQTGMLSWMLFYYFPAPLHILDSWLPFLPRNLLSFSPRSTANSLPLWRLPPTFPELISLALLAGLFGGYSFGIVNDFLVLQWAGRRRPVLPPGGEKEGVVHTALQGFLRARGKTGSMGGLGKPAAPTAVDHHLQDIRLQLEGGGCTTLRLH